MTGYEGMDLGMFSERVKCVDGVVEALFTPYI